MSETVPQPPSPQPQPPQHRRSSSIIMTKIRRFSRRFSSKTRWSLHIPTKELNVHDVLDELTDDELELAARTSYEYVKNPLPETRELCATSICRRYLESKKGNVALATKKVKATLQFRKEHKIEALMTALEDPQSEAAQSLHHQVKDKKFYVQGYDTDGRATLYFIPRNTTHFDKEWHLKEAIYSIERAIACSKAPDRTINAVVDFSGFSIFRHSPPQDIGKEFLTTLRSHYAGQIHKIFLLDCPTSFHILWRIFSPFIGTDTRSKIQFLSGPKEKMTMTNSYLLDELPSFVHPHGGKVHPLDVNEYLFELRFNQAFGDKPISKQ
jgi:hypothetical protein